MALRVGINGFGRIGRNLYRAALGDARLEIVAVNDLFDPRTLAHLLQYDSILGPLGRAVEAGDDWLSVDGRRVRVTAERDPSALDWPDVAIVAECSGQFTRAAGAARHLHGGVRKVVVSAPVDDADVTLVLGVNEDAYQPSRHRIVSNASCTTNCLAPLAKVIHDRFGIVAGSMTTVHSYTSDQRLLDSPHRDLRRARAAGLSMIPTSTGAARALHLVIPDLKGKLDGFSLRVPTPDVSLVDLVAHVGRATSVEEVLAALEQAAAGRMRGILRVEKVELVSSDFRGDPCSSIVDARLTRVIQGTCVKVVSWYDNEWGYACRLRDLLLYLERRGL